MDWGTEGSGAEAGLETRQVLTELFLSVFETEKKGPIYDVVWSPNSSEFCVVYGFMPAKATVFNLKCDPVFDFGTGPRNAVYYRWEHTCPEFRCCIYKFLAGYYVSHVTCRSHLKPQSCSSSYVH